ncbi:MAG: sensor histidine kinase [Putridiphycobacter sp.]
MSFFTPNTDFYRDYFDKDKYTLAWRISGSFTLIFLILTIIYFYLQTPSFYLTGITFLFGLSAFIYLNITKKYRILFLAFAICGTVISNFGINYVTTAAHYVDFIWLVTCVLAAFVGVGKKAGITLIIIDAIAISYFYYFSLNNLLTTIEPITVLGLIGEHLELMFAFIVMSILMYKFAHYQIFSQDVLSKVEKAHQEKSSENTILVKEIHHRVKNNLQIIISLLRLQKNELKSEEAKHSFSEAINRIMVMSLIHEKLYRNKSLSQLNLEDYLTDLIKDILVVFKKNETTTLHLEAKCDIGLKTIVPLGLLINELVSNSLKHAFTCQEHCDITIQLRNGDNNNYKLFYKDNGNWKEPKADYTSFGLELIEIMTSQLEGHFDRKSSPEGTIYNFDLKNID